MRFRDTGFFKALTKVVFALILFMQIFTYGHAYNNISSSYIDCWANCVTKQRSETDRFVTSFFSGIFFPLYWSAHFQEK